LGNFDQPIVEMDQFEESLIDDDPISILYPAMAEGLLAEDSCNACQSFYDTIQKPGMMVNDLETPTGFVTFRNHNLAFRL
jgi:hypothetical protein